MGSAGLTPDLPSDVIAVESNPRTNIGVMEDVQIVRQNGSRRPTNSTPLPVSCVEQ